MRNLKSQLSSMLTAVSILALSATLGVAGCKKDDKAPPATDDKAMAKPEEAKPIDQKPIETAPTPPAADPAAAPPPVGATGLPAECEEYKTGIAKLATCDKLTPETKDTLKKAFDQASAGWATVAPEGRATLASTCKSAVDALKSATAACN